MDRKKRKGLGAAGWEISSVEELLGLTPYEMHCVELNWRCAGASRRNARSSGAQRRPLHDVVRRPLC